MKFQNSIFQSSGEFDERPQQNKKRKDKKHKKGKKRRQRDQDNIEDSTRPSEDFFRQSDFTKPSGEI